jgi:hypothetical protein
MEPLVLTYDNAPTENTRFFVTTLQQTKWKYKLVGEGEKWVGFLNKMNGYLRELSSLKDDQVVVLSDARDVVALRPPSEFGKGFLSYGGRVVVSMELFCEGYMTDDRTTGVQCIPLTKYWKHYNLTELPNRKYVNSGLIAGYAKDLIRMLSWILEHKYTDDQLGLCNYLNAFPHLVYADVKAEMLHTSGSAVCCCTYNNTVQSSDSPTIAELLGCGAFFLHIPGHSASKGQKFMYETVLDFLKHLNGKKLTDVYSKGPIMWNEISVPS